ncbi:MAG: Holliday junction branch migration DNA helicase RuvB [Patescibacteria group bacterium]
MEENIIQPQEKEEDKILDTSLRPKALLDFVGQEKIKEHLTISTLAAKGRREPLEHVLLYGNPGLGKTTLAHIIANEMGAGIRIASGPSLERIGDLAAILSNLEPGDVLFIDEIHRLNRAIEEVLYPAMEDYALDIIIGKGPAARTLRLDLPRFTIIGATTRLSLLSAPLRDRFGVTYRLNYYSNDDLEKIIRRNAAILGIKIDDESTAEIARRTRFTPRIANRLLKRVRDFAEVKNNGIINIEVVRNALEMLEIDHLGLDKVDREILETIVKKFAGGPVGIGTLAAATREEEATIEEVYEPFLIQMGMLTRTPRGRVATANAYLHLGLQPPEKQELL